MSDRVELRDAPARRVALALGGLVAALLLVCAAVVGMVLSFDRSAPPAAPPPPGELVSPEPRLQVDERVQRVELERAAAAALRPAPGRVGIDAAMAKVAREGWPTSQEPRR